jgi:AraC family chitin signaling transcriptional activator
MPYTFEDRNASNSSLSPPKTKIHPAGRSRIKKREGWVKFEDQFQLRHPDFLHRLARSFPELSSSELQICAMLRESLRSWQIADILFISERSVDNHRCNIRRKLRLLQEQNLKTFLIGY